MADAVGQEAVVEVTKRAAPTNVLQKFTNFAHSKKIISGSKIIAFVRIEWTETVSMHFGVCQLRKYSSIVISLTKRKKYSKVLGCSSFAGTKTHGYDVHILATLNS